MGSIVRIVTVPLLKRLLFRLLLQMNQLFGNQRWFLRPEEIALWNNGLSYTWDPKDICDCRSVVATVSARQIDEQNNGVSGS